MSDYTKTNISRLGKGIGEIGSLNKIYVAHLMILSRVLNEHLTFFGDIEFIVVFYFNRQFTFLSIYFETAWCAES